MLVLISLGYLWAAIFLVLGLLVFSIVIAWKSILKDHSKVYVKVEKPRRTNHKSQ